MLIKKLKSTYYYRFLTPLLTFFYRACKIQVGDQPIFYGTPIIQRHPASSIGIGHRVILCSDSHCTALALNHPVKIATIQQGAKITIGHDVGISGACIVCSLEITIGSEVLMGANVLIVDTDFHPINPVNRRYSDDNVASIPVNIGNNVFLGAGVTILKGVEIGDDSIVAASAVVIAGKYPKGVILAGNPARIIGSVYEK